MHQYTTRKLYGLKYEWLSLKSVGIIRATGIIWLINLTHILFRGVYFERSQRKKLKD